MDMSVRIVIGVLIAAWLLIKVAPRLLVQLGARFFFKAVGKSALAKVPQQIQLSHVNIPQWNDAAAMRQQTSPLVQAGFDDLGTFSVDKMQGVLLRMLFQPQTYVAAHVYEHPKAGSWIEFATRYTDGSSDYLTTLADKGLTPPPFSRTTRASKSTPTDQLYQQHLQQRKPSGIKPISPNDVVHEFEEGYMRYMIWKNNTGLSSEEVARAASEWAKAKQQAAGR